MKINNVSISNFGCKLIGYEVLESDMDYKSEWAPKSLTPITDLGQVKYKTMRIDLLLEANDRIQLEKNKSLLQSNIRQGVVILPDSTMEYDGVMESVRFLRITDLVTRASVLFSCIMVEPETIINLNKSYSQSVNIKGNSEVEVIYTVSTATTIPVLKINDITINNVVAGQTLIIDGVKKKVTSNGANKFKDSDFVKFPTLQAGNNTITINVLTPTITVKYKPRWC